MKELAVAGKMSADTELHERPTFYRDLLDSLPEGMIVADRHLNIISVNEPSELILNISRRKTIGRHISSFLPEEITGLCSRAVKEERIVQENDLLFRISPDSSINVECTVSPIHGSDGGMNGLIIQIRNTEKMNMMSIISRNCSLEENYETLVRGLAHEIRNPLSGIKGAAQLLNGTLSKTEKNKCSKIIIKETERLEDLFNRLVKPSSVSIQHLMSVDINEILLDIIFLESNLHKNINFRPKLDIAIPPIPGDYNSLKQVFINIIQNAVSSIRKKGEITISTRWVTDYKIRNKHTVLISVKDNGTGIQKKDLKKIFTPFFSSKKKGTGLGLFISSQVIAKYGGIITAESDEEEGSEFRIQLPAS
ncbi:MAG: ATP-binding protein [Candidatus Dadabacteria bacterium]|nr:ATP-binding protein [Candidatus Dadabacteria bacterium]